MQVPPVTPYLESYDMSEPFIFTKDTVLKFGKYKGKTVQYVIDWLDTNYLVWCLANVPWFKMSIEDIKFVEERAKEETRLRNLRKAKIAQQRHWDNLNYSSRRTNKSKSYRRDYSDKEWSTFDSDFGGFNSFW